MTLHNLHLDLEKSLSECPPDYFPKGVTHLKRIRARRDLCTWAESNQTKQNINTPKNIKKLVDSYTMRGFMYTERPQVVIVDPQNPKRFLGLAGFNRHAAQERLNWDIALYDLVECASPLDQIIFSYQTNHILSPRQELKVEDFVRGVSMAVENEMIKNEDQPINDYIKKIAADQPETTQKLIFKKFRNEKSAWSSMQPLDGDSAQELAKELEVPYGTKEDSDSYKLTGEYGLIKEPGGYKSTMVTGLNIWLNEDEPVNITGYINHPKPADIHIRRKKWKKEIDKMNDFIYKVSSKITDMPLKEVVKKGRSPFVFNGFLPQVIQADPTKGGRPLESGLVDEDGSSFNKNT